jgi:hypothetical protein
MQLQRLLSPKSDKTKLPPIGGSFEILLVVQSVDNRVELVIDILELGSDITFTRSRVGRTLGTHRTLAVSAKAWSVGRTFLLKAVAAQNRLASIWFKRNFTVCTASCTGSRKHRLPIAATVTSAVSATSTLIASAVAAAKALLLEIVVHNRRSIHALIIKSTLQPKTLKA